MARDNLPKKVVPPTTTQLGMGYVSSNIIQPGAHPEYAQGTKLGNPVEQIGGFIKKLTQKKKRK